MITTYCIKNTSSQIVDISNIVKAEMKLKKSISEFAWTLDFNITKKPSILQCRDRRYYSYKT